MALSDTIVAIASAPGRGAIGIVRLSGEDVPRLAALLLAREPVPRTACLARFLDARGEPIDEGIAVYYAAPASYTGEHVLELFAHGGVVVLDLLLRRALELGCRAARPGEFSERAFLNGKMDVAQAEAVADLIDAGTQAAARAAVRSMRGEFSSRIRELQGRLTDLRVQVEASIDFAEEDLGLPSAPAIAAALGRVLDCCDSIALAARQGALLREGLTVVIAGKPNVGKSSLLNRLAGEEIAIVTDTPGTTRDVLHQQVHLDGVPLHLIDTAGLRRALDAAEAEGVRRAHLQMQVADRILYVLDASAPEPPRSAESDLETLPQGIPVTLVLNKIDLTGTAPGVRGGDAPTAHVSARSGAGIEHLKQHLKRVAGFCESEAGVFAARRRHLDALRRAREHLSGAARALGAAQPAELFAEDLRLAQLALGEITGEVSSEDLLGEIFGSFCIGK